MNKALLLIIFICLSPTLSFAQQFSQNEPFWQKIMDYFNPNKPMSFTGEGLQININWEKGMRYQVIFTQVPDRLTHYLDLDYDEPYDGSIKILFWDKDNKKIDEESLYLKQDCILKDTVLNCRSFDYVIQDTTYRKITSGTVTIN